MQTDPGELQGVLLTAQLMCVSARTAPKTRGQDYISTRIISGEELERLAGAMLEMGRATGRPNLERDANNMKKSGAIVLIGLKDSEPAGMNCGTCGFGNCEEVRKRKGSGSGGPVCAWRLVDLGIALGSAAKTASIMNVDNRIMLSLGSMAKRLGLCDNDVAIAIPLSATGKSIYFDRQR